MSPYLQDADCTIYQGDALEVLRQLPDESVHMCCTSPPFYGLRDYQTGRWEGGDPGCDHTAKANRGDRPRSGLTGGLDTVEAATIYRDSCGKCGARRVDQQIGLEPTPDEWVARLVEVFREVRRVLRSDGTLWVEIGDSYAGHNATGFRPGNEAKNGGVSNKNGVGTIDGYKPKDLIGAPWLLAEALKAPYYTGKIKDERDRIWLAATVEAEGCLFIHRRKAGTSSGAKFTKKDGTRVEYDRTKDTFGAGLEVASTDRVVAERCQTITGIGSICEQTPEQNPGRKQTIYRWNVRSNECRWIVRELYPHMIAKQHEARLLIGCPSSGDDARKAWESLKNLHQGQTASMDFAPPEGMWERGWFLRSEIIWAKLFPTRCPNR